MASPTKSRRLDMDKCDYTSWEKRQGRIFQEEEIQVLQAAIAKPDRNVINHRSGLTRVAAETLNCCGATIPRGGYTLQPLIALTKTESKDSTLDPVALDCNVSNAKMTFRASGRADVKLRHLLFTFRRWVFNTLKIIAGDLNNVWILWHSL
jgi:hypothetical protein